MKEKILLIAFTLLSGIMLQAQSTLATVGAFHVNTDNNISIIASVQPYASVNSSETGTIITGWFPFLLSGTSTNAVDLYLNDEISVFPNPGSDEIYLQRDHDNHKVLQLVLNSIDGKVLYTGQWKHGETHKINVAGFPSGAHILMMIDQKTYKRRFEKIIVE